MPAVGSSRMYLETMESIEALGERVTVLEENPNSWVKVAEITVATPETAIAVEALDLDADGPYSMVLNLVNPTEDFVGYYLYFNGDREDASYWRQFFAADDEVRTSGRRNDPRLTGVEPGETALVEVTMMRGPDGLARCNVSVNRNAPAEVLSLAHKLVWAIQANVTKIEVVSETPDAIGAGSTLLLHRLE